MVLASRVDAHTVAVATLPTLQLVAPSSLAGAVVACASVAGGATSSDTAVAAAAAAAVQTASVAVHRWQRQPWGLCH